MPLAVPTPSGGVPLPMGSTCMETPLPSLPGSHCVPVFPGVPACTHPPAGAPAAEPEAPAEPAVLAPAPAPETPELPPALVLPPPVLTLPAVFSLPATPAALEPPCAVAPPALAPALGTLLEPEL